MSQHNINRKVNLENLLDKVKKHPNSPKVQEWKKQIATLKREMNLKTTNNGLLAPKPVPMMSELNFNSDHYENEMAKPIMSDEKQSVIDSTLCLSHPDTIQHRLCDAVTQPVNLLRSVAEYVVSVNFDGSSHSGAFSIATQPSIGSLTDPKKQAVGIVDTTAGWPNDFTLSSSYVNSSAGLNPKFDNNVLELISSKSQVRSHTRSFLSYNTSITNDGFMFGNNGAVASGRSEISTLNTELVSIPTGTYTGPGGSLALTNSYGYRFASGTYLINIAVSGVTALPFGGTVGFALVDENNNLQGRVYWNSAGDTLYTGTVFQDNIQVLNAFESVTASVSQEVGEVASIMYRHDGSLSLVPTVSWVTAVTIPELIAHLSISTASSPQLPSVSNNGMVVAMRPIAHSALLTNLLPEILAGGNIVSYSAPSNDVRNMYYSRNNLIQPQEWYQLATLNKGNLMHDGPVKDGTYVFTQPWSENDLLLRSPSEVNDYSYPGIIISGSVVPPNGYTGNISAFRLRVITLWEFVTDSPIFNPRSLIGNPVLSGEVMALLARMQHAMPNNKHKKYLSTVYKALSKNKNKPKSSWFGEALDLAGSAFTALESIL